MKLSLAIKLCGLTAILAMSQGCGKKDKKSNPAPIQPNVEITGLTSEGDMTTVTYRSTQENVAYECKVDRGVQEGPWTECPPSGFAFRTDSSVKVKFSVRAKNGTILSEIASRDVDASSNQKSSFQVEIVEKANPKSALQTNGQYQITFFAKGTDSQNLQYMCKVGAAQAKNCTSPFSFSSDNSGNAPTVNVYAIDLNTNANSDKDYIDLSATYDSSNYRTGAFSDYVQPLLGDPCRILCNQCNDRHSLSLCATYPTLYCQS